MVLCSLVELVVSKPGKSSRFFHLPVYEVLIKTTNLLVVSKGPLQQFSISKNALDFKSFLPTELLVISPKISDLAAYLQGR